MFNRRTHVNSALYSKQCSDNPYGSVHQLPCSVRLPSTSAQAIVGRAGLAPHQWLVLGVFVLMVLASANASAQVFKYEVDGRIVYQDRAPSSSQDDGHSVLNEQGMVLKQILSREERRAEQERARERKLARIRDRALLATFTEEEDLLRTRQNRVGLIDGLIARLDDRILILTERLVVVEKRIALQVESRGAGKAQQSLYAEQRDIQRNIENTWALIDAKADEREAVSNKFDADLKRYRELKQQGR